MFSSQLFDFVFGISLTVFDFCQLNFKLIDLRYVHFWFVFDKLQLTCSIAIAIANRLPLALKLFELR